MTESSIAFFSYVGYIAESDIDGFYFLLLFRDVPIGIDIVDDPLRKVIAGALGQSEQSAVDIKISGEVLGQEGNGFVDRIPEIAEQPASPFLFAVEGVDGGYQARSVYGVLIQQTGDPVDFLLIVFNLAVIIDKQIQKIFSS
jgi:hypothetical protein